MGKLPLISVEAQVKFVYMLSVSLILLLLKSWDFIIMGVNGSGMRPTWSAFENLLLLS